MVRRELRYEIQKNTVFNIFVVVFFLRSLPLCGRENRENSFEKVILKDTSLKPEEMTKELKRKIWDEMSYAFNFEEMTKFVMGNHWKKRSNEEKKEFIEIFTLLS